jgi:hypothetical protein
MYNIYILTRVTVESKVNLQVPYPVSCLRSPPGHVPLYPQNLQSNLIALYQNLLHDLICRAPQLKVKQNSIS